MAVALLLATVFVGAIEAQTVAQTLYTDTTPVDTFLAAHPGSSISSIDQNGVTVRTTKGKTRILSPGLTYQNGSTWAVTKAQVNLLSASAGWSLTGTPVPILISGSGSSMHVTVGSGTKTLDWRLSSIAYASAKGFTFQSGGLAWTLNLHNSGVDFQSQVTAKKGVQTFTFPYTFTAGTVSVDSKGNLNFGSVFSTSHSGIIGADHKIYPCGAWTVANSVASFSCDDTALPAAAYPYLIDPTTVTYAPASYTCYDPIHPSADNGTYCTLGYGYYYPYGNPSTYTATFSVGVPAGATVTDVAVNYEGVVNSGDGAGGIVPVLTAPAGSITQFQGFLPDGGPAQTEQWDIANTSMTLGYSSTMLSWFNLQNGSVTFTFTPQNDDSSGYGYLIVYDNPSLAISYTEPPSGTAQIGAGAAVAGQWTYLSVGVNVQPGPNSTGTSIYAGFTGTIIVNTSPSYPNGCNISLSGTYSWMPGEANPNGGYELLNDSGAPVPGNVSNECAIQAPAGVPTVSGPTASGYYNFVTSIPIYLTIAGPYTIWGNFTDTGSGLTSGWLNLGTVNIAPHIITAGNSTVSASLASVPADNATTSTITVTLKDASGNPVSGKTVTLAQGAGHSTISAASGGSNASGAVTFTVKDATVETVTYTATDATDSINITQSATVSFTAGVPTAGNSTVSASLASVPADNTTTTLITVTLKDGYGHPVSGKTVTLGQGAGHSTISAASGASNVNGVVTFTVRDATVETVTYTATDVTDSVNIAQSPTVSFTTGVPTAGNSTVSASVTSVPADNTTTSTITVTLIDGNGHPVSGKTVTLAQGAGHSTISAGSGASNASGVVTFTVKDATVETVIYTATDAADSVNITQSATVSFVAGVPTAGNSTVSASLASVPADNTTTSTITVTLKDGYGHPVSGKTVTLAQWAGHSSISAASGASNASGVVSFTVKDATAETVTYTATDTTDSVSITQTATVSFTAGVPTAGTSTVVASVATVPADNTTTSTITVTVKDGNGNPVSGKTVTLAQGAGHSSISAASGASNASGVVSFTVKDATIETVTYTATDTTDSVSITQSATVTFTAGVPTAGNSTVSASLASVPADNNTTSTITITLTDGNGHPVSGKTVTLAQGAGHSTISAASGASNASGVVTFTVKDATAETVTYTATDATDSVSITQSATVSFTAGVPTAGNSTASASLASVPADNTTTSTITVTLKDGNGNPVSGKTVTLAQGAGHSSISAASGASNATGVVSFTVKDATVETVTYTATDTTDSVSITQSASVSFAAGVPTAGNSTVSASLASVPADNTTTSTITVTLTDRNGHPASGKTVTLAQGTGHSTISAASGASNGSGVVTFTVKDATAETVIYTATDATDSVSITQSATVSFTAGVPTAGTSTMSASPASVQANNTTTSTITVTLKDGNGNPVSGKTVTLAQGAGHSTISAASGASNASGVVTFTVKDATIETVTYTATDTTDSVSIMQGATVSFTAGPPPPDFSLSIAPPTATMVAGSTPASYTIAVSPLSGFAGTVSFAVSGLPSGAVATFSPTTVSGSASTTLSISFAVAGNYSFTVTASSSSLSHSVTAILSVQDYTWTVSPLNQSVATSGYSGAYGTFTISATGLNGFNKTILPTIQACQNPVYETNLAVSQYPASFASPGSTTFTVGPIAVYAPSTATTWCITVSDAGGGHPANVWVTATANPALNLQISGTLAISPPGSATYSMVVYETGNLSGTVSLSVTNSLPAGVSASFSPSTLSLSPTLSEGVSVLTLTAASGTALGTYPITITATGGGAIATATVSLVATGPNQAVGSLSPSDGPVGTQVTISGLNFGATQGSSTVTFGGIPATSFPSWGPASITVVVPAGALTGPVVVTVGGVPSSGGPIFTVSPSISSLNVYSGPVNTQVSIAGLNFGSTPGSVTFGGIPATSIPSWGPASITAVVPTGAVTGQVVVTAGGLASSAGPTFTVVQTLSITGPASLPAGEVNSAYPATTITASGGSGNYTWSATGLPAGLSIASATGAISGTPTISTGSPFTVQVTVTDSSSATANQSYTLTVNSGLVISGPASLPAGAVNTAYTATTITAAGGSGTYTWSATGLPAGLSIASATGTISGTPTTSGPSSVQVTVTDSTSATASKTYPLTIAAPCSPAKEYIYLGGRVIAVANCGAQ